MFGGAQQTSNAFGQNAMSKQTSGGFGATTSGFGSSMTNSASAFGSAGQTGMAMALVAKAKMGHLEQVLVTPILLGPQVLAETQT